MRTLVIGGSGFIGSWAIRALAKEGIDVAVCDLRPPDMPASGTQSQSIQTHVDYTKVDILDYDNLKEALRSMAPDVIVHLAALIARLGDTTPVESARVNCLGACNVFDAAVACEVRRVVYASSSAVFKGYGQEGGPIGDETVPDPRNVYGAGKAYVERLARHYASRDALETVGLRFGVVHGPGRPIVDELLTKPALTGKGRVPYGQESCEWLWVGDAAEAVAMACSAKTSEGAVLNIGGYYGTVLEAVDLARELLPAAEIDVEMSPRFERFAPQLDCASAKVKLDWWARTTPREWFQLVIEQATSAAFG